MESMMKLIKNCDVYAPEHLGTKDILIADGRIYMIEDDLSRFMGRDEVEVLELDGGLVCPGLVDLHIHVTGGGGEQGPSSRVPEIRASELFQSGVTTLLGLLGTDGVSRSLENLLFKCRALEEEGLTTFMLTGSYRYPSPTLTGDVERDIALIDKIVGVKLAISDHRGSGVTGEELIRLGSEARIGGMLAGKPGIVVLHTGVSEAKLEPLFYAIEHSDVPCSNYLPTHCCRTPQLIADAVRFNKLGGTIDFTADSIESEAGTAAAVKSALERGADASRITMSSDACGSQPVFDKSGVCTGLTYTSPITLIHELRRMVKREGVPLSTALRFFTENPARVLGVQNKKGRLVPGADADIAVFDKALSLKYLFARGKTAVANGSVVMKGRFES